MIDTRKTLESLFSEPFGQGYPGSEASRKLEDTEKLKQIRRNSQVQMEELLSRLDASVMETVKKKKNVLQYVKEHGKKKFSVLTE